MENYAGFWLRFAAALIDGLIVGAFYFVIMLVFGGALGASAQSGYGSEAALGGGIMLIYLILIVAQWLYFALMESSEKQATLGKMALGIVVTDMNGQRISFGKATGRYFGKILSGLILYIGYIMAGFTERKQALHDMLAGCLVVKGQPGMVGTDPNVFN